MKRKLIGIFFCRRESVMCNALIKLFMNSDIKFNILQMPLSVIFLIESDYEDTELLYMISQHGIKTMAIVYDVTTTDNDILEGNGFHLSYSLPKEHSETLDQFVGEGLCSVDMPKNREELERFSQMRAGDKEWKTKVNVSTLTLDEILDIANERGGIHMLRPSEKARLDELTKK